MMNSLQLAVASICVFVILPLTLVGTVLGRNLSGTPNYPCRINAVPRSVLLSSLAFLCSNFGVA